MANRRMVNKQIVTTDKFMELPITAQCLYFHLIITADDDGFIDRPKTISRMVGASNEDLQILVNMNYLIDFDSGVVVITDWHVHNLIRTDRYKETMYIDEKRLLTQNKNKQYQLFEGDDNQTTTNGIPNDNQTAPQVSIGKDSIGKDSIGKDNTPIPPQNEGAGDGLESGEDLDVREYSVKVALNNPTTHEQDLQDKETSSESLSVGEHSGKVALENSTTLMDERFEKFWEVYPKKVGKKYARKCFVKLKPDKTLFEHILNTVQRAKKSERWIEQNGRFIPNPSTWINQGRWDDEIVDIATDSKLDRQMQVFDELESEMWGGLYEYE